MIVEHIGTAHDEAELAVLMEIAREKLRPGQEALDLDLEDAPAGPARTPGVITSKRALPNQRCRCEDHPGRSSCPHVTPDASAR